LLSANKVSVYHVQNTGSGLPRAPKF